jgi:glutathione S-transferase
MDLYFSPLACSLASRIVAYEAGLDLRFDRVDGKAGKTASGQDYAAINPMLQVPALRTDDGVVLTENAAILQYLGDRRPDAGLVPAPGGLARYKLQQWLSFISSELHKPVFTPLLGTTFPEDARQKAREMAPSRLQILNDHLTGRDWLLDDFSVADAYLAAVLNWNQVARFDLSAYPAIQAYQARLAIRPAVTKAVAEEFALYQAA